MDGISSLVREYDTSLSDTRQLVEELKPKIAGLRKERELLMSQPIWLTAAEAKAYGVTLDEGWMLKLTPKEGGYSTSLVTPGKWEMLEDETYMSPEGKPATRAEFEAQFQGGDYSQLWGVFGKVFPDQDIGALLATADADPWGFLVDIRNVGWTSDTEALLKAMFPDITDAMMAEIFWSHAGAGAGIPTYELSEDTLNSIRNTGRTPEAENLLKTQFPGIPDEKISEIFWKYVYPVASGPSIEYALDNPQTGPTPANLQNNLLWKFYQKFPKDPFARSLVYFNAGCGDILTGLGAACNWQGIDWLGERLQSMGEKAEVPQSNPNIRGWRRWIDPRTYTTDLPRMLPFTLALIPIMLGGGAVGGVAAGVLGLGRVGTMILTAILGGTASRAVESATEAGQAYDRGLLQGMTREEADAAADGVFVKNMGLAGNDALQFAVGMAKSLPGCNNPFMRLVAKVGFSAITEGGEEGLQDIFHRQAMGEPIAFDYRMQEAIIAGGMMGIGFGAIVDTYQRIYTKAEENLPDNLLNKYYDNLDAAMAAGVPIDRAKKEAMDLITDTPAGRAAVQKAIDDVIDEEMAKEEVLHAGKGFVIPSSEDIIADAFASNFWKRRAQAMAEQLPAFKTAITKAMGPRELTQLDSKVTEDVVARNAILWAEIEKRGRDIAAVEAWVLRGIHSNPVKLFSFNDHAYSSKMSELILPEYRSDEAIMAAAGTVEHVFTHSEMYKLSDRQTRYIDKVRSIFSRVLKMKKVEGTAPKKLVVGEYIHRVVTGQWTEEGVFMPKRGKPGVGGRTLGALESAAKHRTFKTQAEGIAAGIAYSPNIELSVTSAIEDAYRGVADARFAEEIAEFGEKPAEVLAQKYPDLNKRLNLTKKQLEQVNKLTGAIDLTLKGGRPAPGQLKAIERIFPQWGRELRRLTVEGVSNEKALRESMAWMKQTNSQLQKLVDFYKQKAEALSKVSKEGKVMQQVAWEEKEQKLRKDMVLEIDKAKAEMTALGIDDKHRIAEVFKLLAYEDRVTFRDAYSSVLMELGTLQSNLQGELETYLDTLANDPVARWRGAMPLEPKQFTKREQAAGITRKRKFKPFKEIKLTDLLEQGQWPETISIKQAKALTGDIALLPNVMDKTGKRVRWEYVLDQIADEIVSPEAADKAGMNVDAYLTRRVEQVYAMEQQVNDLRVFLYDAVSRQETIKGLLAILDSVDANYTTNDESMSIDEASDNIAESQDMFGEYGAAEVTPELAAKPVTRKPGKAIGIKEFAGLGETGPWRLTLSAYKAIMPSATGLVESRTREEIQKKLETIFGSYESLEKIDAGEASYTIEAWAGTKSDTDYMADIEYAAAGRDYAETKELLDAALEEIHGMYVKEAVAEGKAVDSKVLADYPGLKPVTTTIGEAAIEIQLRPIDARPGEGFEIVVNGKIVGELDLRSTESLGITGNMLVDIEVFAEMKRKGIATQALDKVLLMSEEQKRPLYSGLLKPEGELWLKGLEEHGVIKLEKQDQRLLGFLISRPEAAPEHIIPKAAPGMPEAGLQKDIFGYYHPVEPKGKGKVVNISMDEYAKYQKAWKDSGQTGTDPNIGYVPWIENVNEGESFFRREGPAIEVMSKTERQAALRALQVEVNSLQIQRKGLYETARSKRARQMEKIRMGGMKMVTLPSGEAGAQGYIMQPMFGGKLYHQDFIDSINTFFGHEKGNKALAFTSDAAGILRITKAAYDASVMMIQGQLAFGLAHATLLTNPVLGSRLMGSWFKALGHSVGCWFDMDMAGRYIAANEEPILQRISMGGSAQSVDYFQALHQMEGGGLGARGQKFLQAFPGKPFQRAETSFFIGAEILRDELWKAMGEKAMAKGEGFELARFADRSTGIIDLKAIGVPLTVRQIESSGVWFAPRFTNAMLAVAGNIFRGGMTGAMAKKSMAGLLGAMAIYTGALAFSRAMLEGDDEGEAMRKLWENYGIKEDPITHELTWEPSAKFMSVQVANYNFGVGGFWYGMVRLLGNITACVNEVGDKEHIDLIKIMKYGGMNRDNPFIYWWYSRISPLVGTIREMVSGRTFMGTPIETKAEYAFHMISRFTPIWMEQGLFPYAVGKTGEYMPNFAAASDMPEGIARFITPIMEFFGMRTWPEGEWGIFYDKTDEIIKTLPREFLEQYYTPEEMEKILAAQADGSLTWKQLTKTARQDLLTLYPELAEAYENAGEASALSDSDAWKSWAARLEAERESRNTTIDTATAQWLRGEITAREWDALCDGAEKIYGAGMDDMDVNPAYAEVRDYFEKHEGMGDKYDWQDDRLLAEYESIIYADYYDEATLTMDWDERERRITEFIEKHGMNAYQRMRWYKEQKRKSTGVNDVRLRHAEDLDKLGREYWDTLPYQILSKMDEKDIAEGSVPSEYLGLVKEFIALNDEEQEAFLESHPEMTKDFRAEYRASNIEQDAMLKFWGYGGDLQSMDAYNKCLDMAREFRLTDEALLQMELPPQNIVEDFFGYKDLTRTLSGNSADAKLFRLEHPAFAEWGTEAYGWSDLADENIDILRLKVQFKEEFNQYDLLPDTDQRKKYLEANPEFTDAYYRVGAASQGYSEEHWDRYVEYSKLPMAGDWRERYLLENPDFYDEWLSEDIGQGHQRITEADVSPVERDEIYQQFTEQFKAWDDTAGMTETEVGAMREVLLRDPGFAEARIKVQAYDDGVPEDFIDNVVEYRQMPQAGYANDRYLKEHPDFYRDVWLNVWENNEVDFSKIPTIEVERLYATYQGLPAGNARLDFRAQHLDLDAWLVAVKGYTPISSRGSTETPKTAWEIAEEARRVKELLEKLRG